MSGSTGRMQLRVRYSECDPMGLAHHSVYPVWFEAGRTELLRSRGINYRDLEAGGILLAVVSLSIKYKRPARYDDELTLETRILKAGRAKIEHGYSLYRDGELLTAASTVLACLGRGGRVRPMPPILLEAC